MPTPHAQRSNSASIASWLNQRCACVTLNRSQLQRELCGDPRDGALLAMVEDARPNLFSDTTVFVGERDLATMRAFVAAHERIVALPGWQSRVLADAPASAVTESAARSVFMGYDFHLGDEGPRLIEINTNAGGGLLNAALARAQFACCNAVRGDGGKLESGADVATEFLHMFRKEWQLARGDEPLAHIAIVDAAPASQYLLPEFLLFQRLFERAGIRTSICDPAELRVRDGRLYLGDDGIDLVYNRSTDFAFDQPESAALRQAWLGDLAVITPHPRAHALYADKRHLALLSDTDFLASIGVAASDIALCEQVVPPTRRVERAEADTLWQTRREWFFKPASGFGSKAAYRGDKLTRRVLDEILAGDYVAQRIVSPSSRVKRVDGSSIELKSDLRAYAYCGQVQLFAARLYRGQTTNFRTPGGGFAAVASVPEAQRHAQCDALEAAPAKNR